MRMFAPDRWLIARMRAAAGLAVVWALLLLALPLAGAVSQTGQTSDIPELTAPVNDFAGVIDAASRATLERMIRSLQSATGDVVVVATVKSVAPYADIDEYAVKMFENRGRGIGEKGKDNGVLVVLSTGDRRVRVEVGYGLEGAITDGFAGETSRNYMLPHFREGRYGEGLTAGVARLIGRIGQERNVTLTDLPASERPARESQDADGTGIPLIVWVLLAVVVIQVISSLAGGGGGRGRRSRHWTSGSWSGWSGGVGPFGGQYGGWGGGGGGFSGGGGGFGGGRSGGGGGGAGW